MSIISPLRVSIGSGSLFEDTSREREILVPIARLADLVVDTGRMSVHDLKRQILRHFAGGERAAAMEIELVSFGFRHGAPEAADLLIDVRFLPNPNFEPSLRAHTGLEPEVAAFVLDPPSTGEFMAKLRGFIDFLIPRYEKEGKARLTIARLHRRAAPLGGRGRCPGPTPPGAQD